MVTFVGKILNFRTAFLIFLGAGGNYDSAYKTLDSNSMKNVVLKVLNAACLNIFFLLHSFKGVSVYLCNNTLKIFLLERTVECGYYLTSSGMSDFQRYQWKLCLIKNKPDNHIFLFEIDYFNIVVYHLQSHADLCYRNNGGNCQNLSIFKLNGKWGFN